MHSNNENLLQIQDVILKVNYFTIKNVGIRFNISWDPVMRTEPRWFGDRHQHPDELRSCVTTVSLTCVTINRTINYITLVFTAPIF